MLREEAVEPGTLELLKKLTSLPELKPFRLVGGTALSLLYGHRKSIDLGHNIPFADIKDLAALKLNAVKGRGEKKDFWDVARLLNDYTFNDLFKFYHDRYNYDDTFAVIRSVIYFTDAEDTLEPEPLDGMTWEHVKTTILKAFDNYYKNIRN